MRVFQDHVMHLRIYVSINKSVKNETSTNIAMNFYMPCFSDCSHCECHIAMTHLSLLSGFFLAVG